jgi:phage terminase Nu1 subunit (DNA packaging protein)
MADYTNLITRQHLSELLGCSTQTVARWEKVGLPVIHVGIGKIPRYDFLEVFSWIHKQEDISLQGDGRPA